MEQKASGERHPAHTLSSALERICFLEWRLEQMESLLADERRIARDMREELAEAAQREHSAALEITRLEERLLDAKRELVSLSDRTSHADAERSLLERRIAASGQQTSKEIAELCRELEHERAKGRRDAEALAGARDRLAALERARESFFARLIEWQQLSRADDVDLAEFIAELRGEILALTAEKDAIAAREEDLRERLGEAAEERPADPTPMFLAPSEPRTPATGIQLDDARSVLAQVPSDAKRATAQRLVGELRRSRADLRLSAAKALVDTAGALAAPALSAALNLAKDGIEKIELLDLLAKAKSPLALPSIRVAMEDRDPYVRAAAVEAGMGLAAGSDFEVIARAGLTDGDVRVRRRAVMALEVHGGAGKAELVRAIASDPDPQARRAVVAALSGDTSAAAVDIAMRALEDDSDLVRRAAARTLSKSTGEEVAPILLLPPLQRKRAIEQLGRRIRGGREGVGDGAN
jgi:HEAT repeat protein